ncbi:MAG: TRAP transporter large permease subunit [Lachnospiraceae bacterium]|nr:TRAP transporter large permease subunit [Lachnospiraceae bacterium]
MIGIGIISLLIYIAAILVINMVLKRKMAEAMLWSFLLILAIGGLFGGQSVAALAQTGIKAAAKQEVVYASMAFVFMAFMMDKTGVIGRLVEILNSVLGRLPGGSGYVSTIASALFGMVSGSGSGNASAVGSITIPWMKQNGWTTERATTIVAGNAGLGMIFPPSSSMLLLLGMEAIAAELTSNELYVGLMCAGLMVLAYRLAVVFLYAKKDGLKANMGGTETVGAAFWKNASSLLIFLGIIVPLLFQMGPTGNAIKAALNAHTEKSFSSISLVMWIPIMMTFFTIVEGWKYLPHSFGGWKDMIKASAPKYSEVGCLLFFAFAAASVLTKLGLQEEFTAVFESLGSYSAILVVLLIAVVTTLMVGPFTGTASTTALGALSYAALRSIGLAPVACCVAFLFLVSNEGCIPPNSAPIYIASGISGLNEPSRIFKNLLFHYALPVVLIAVLIMLGIFPVVGA